LDSDPFYDAQDFDDADPNVRVKATDSNTFEVTLNNFGDETLVYTMQQTSKGWRISDIASPTNKSLVKLLSTK
jgi:hypothetical protein